MQTHMKSCSRTRKVWPDAIVLTEVSIRSPLACPSFRKEYMSTELPTRSVVISLRAHSPFSNSSLAFSSRPGFVFFPDERFLLRAQSAGIPKQHVQRNSGHRYHGAYDQPFLRMLTTVNCTNFWLAIPSSLQGMAVFATHSARVPLGPPVPSRTMLPTYPVKAAAVRGEAQSEARKDINHRVFDGRSAGTHAGIRAFFINRLAFITDQREGTALKF